MIDYHVHSIHSGDAPVSVREMCGRAAEIGITEIAFTEHLDFMPSDISFGALVFPKWMSDIQAARDEFAGRLTIRSGVEVDYQPQFHSKIEAFLSSYKVDYALVSAHYVDGIIMDDQERFFAQRTEQEAYSGYFDVALAAVESRLFDTFAHFDLCKRYGVLHYGPFKPELYQDQIEKVLKAIIRQNMALEINTSGLRQAPKEPYPSLEILKMYSKLGGWVVTIGSDSHNTKQLGQGLHEGLALAKEAGITEIARFDGRARSTVGINSL